MTSVLCKGKESTSTTLIRVHLREIGQVNLKWALWYRCWNEFSFLVSILSFLFSASAFRIFYSSGVFDSLEMDNHTWWAWKEYLLIYSSKPMIQSSSCFLANFIKSKLHFLSSNKNLSQYMYSMVRWHKPFVPHMYRDTATMLLTTISISWGDVLAKLEFIIT